MGRAEFVDLLDKRDAAFKDSRFKMARWATVDEAMTLYTLVLRECPDIILECGTANGWTSATMATATGNIHKEVNQSEIVTIDLADRPKFHVDPRVKYVVGDFRDECKPILERSRYRKKLIFIDGDHSYGGVKTDFQAVEPYLNRDDLVVFHDTAREHGVARFMGELKERDFSLFETYNTRNGMVAIRC